MATGDCPREYQQHIPGEIRRKYHGIKQQMKKQRYKPYLPAIFMGNVKLLVKTDELTALASSQREFRECSIICFTQTWLHHMTP